MKIKTFSNMKKFLIRLSILPYMLCLFMWAICAGIYWIIKGESLSSDIIDKWSDIIGGAEL